VLLQSKKTAGKQALALEAFARALRAIPTILCDNAGFDSAEIVSQMRAAHSKGDRYAGLGMCDVHDTHTQHTLYTFRMIVDTICVVPLQISLLPALET
jgi:hypothetical protein